MAFLEIKNVRIVGIAACVPPRIEENADLPVFIPGEAEKVIEQTGIERKHLVDDGVVLSDLCTKAGEILLERLGWDKDSVDAISLVSLSPDYPEPPTAYIIQHKLGLSEDCYITDINQGCPGWVLGLSSLGSVVNQGTMKRALLFTGDLPFTHNSPLDKEVRPIFGDGCSVTALEYDEMAPPIQFHFGARGKDFDAIIREYGGTVHPITEEALQYVEYGTNIKRRGIDGKMKGMDVFVFGITQVPKSLKELCNHFNLDLQAMDKYLFHQANHYMVDRIRKKMRIDESRVPFSMKDYGNTASASIPLTLVTQCQEEYSSKRMESVACAFGTGLSWCSVHFVTDNIVCPEIIIY